MDPMKDLARSLERLYALRTLGIKPGLDAERALLERLGNPHLGFAALHVAGTNGKGSVCAMLDQVLRTTGLTIGLYTSPHLVRFNERIQVNGTCITDAELAELFDFLEPHAAAVAAGAGGRETTFFEFTTALAFEHFRRRGVRLAVVETGMGGRLDATNVVTPLLAVITRIGLEHTQYLGPTLAAIAGEKAGIVKPGRPVVCGATPEEAQAVIRAAARERDAAFVDAAAAVTVRRVAQDLAGQKLAISSAAADYGRVALPLLGRHQLENVAAVIAALETLATVSPLRLAPEAVRQGLAQVRWPGRLEVLARDPPVILDGAHNPDGARGLAAALKELFKRQPLGLVWGMCDDKDAAGFAAALGDRVKQCWAVPLQTERGLAPAKLAALARARGWPVQEASVPAALAAASAWATANRGAACIAGSLFLAGEVLALRGSHEKETRVH